MCLKDYLLIIFNNHQPLALSLFSFVAFFPADVRVAEKSIGKYIQENSSRLMRHSQDRLVRSRHRYTVTRNINFVRDRRGKKMRSAKLKHDSLIFPEIIWRRASGHSVYVAENRSRRFAT